MTKYKLVRLDEQVVNKLLEIDNSPNKAIKKLLKEGKPRLTKVADLEDIRTVMEDVLERFRA